MMHDKFNRRRATLAGLTSLALLTNAPTRAQSHTWPNKPIRLIIAFPPGGPTDTAARIVAQRLSEALQQSVVVENRPGASGTVGTTQLAKSAPDGYTLTLLATPTLLAPFLYKRVGFDMLSDFTPIALVYELPIVMVVNPKELPDVTDIRSLIAHVRSLKTPLNYTSAGIGSLGHLSTELLKQTAQFDMQHIPYKGSAPAVTDLIAGEVPLMFSDMIAVLPHIQAGRLRPIAVGSPQRVSMLPDVQTIAEQGISDYDAVSWGGLLAPRNTPSVIVERLEQTLQQILLEKTTQEKLFSAGAIAHYEDSTKFGQRVRSDYEKWGKMIKSLNINFG